MPRLSDLNPAELTSLMISVQRVGRVIEREYHADGLTVACQVGRSALVNALSTNSIRRPFKLQDGRAAGQTIPHVHFHLLPRKHEGDAFEGRSDDVYPALERAEGSLPQDLTSVSLEKKPARFKVDADEDRKPRTMEEMEKEAKWLSSFFNTDGTAKE